MKLNYGRTFFVGLAFLSICAFWQMYDTLIPLILKNTFHITETPSGVIMALDNILALFMLPLFGTLSDKLKSPFGKRMPFIVVGTILAVISMTMIPIAEKNNDFIMFIILLGIVLVAMGSYRSPTVALMPDITPKSLRSKANAIINLMGAVGAIYTLIVIKLLLNEKEESSYTNIFVAVAALMVLAVILLVITIREKKLTEWMDAETKESSGLVKQNTEEAEDGKEVIDGKEVNQVKEVKELIEGKDVNQVKEANYVKKVLEDEKEFMGMPSDVRKSFLFILASIFLWFFAYNAVTTAYSRYAQVIWNMKEGGFAIPLLVAMAAALVSYIPIGMIASKIGRKKTIIIGILMMTASYISGALFVHYSFWINIIFIFTGIGWAAISVNSYPMVVEMCKGSDVGKYTGVYYMFSMSAQIITPIVSGALLQYVSYRTLFPYAVIFSVASLCTMLCVKHGDARPEMKKNVIENFDTDD